LQYLTPPEHLDLDDLTVAVNHTFDE